MPYLVKGSCPQCKSAGKLKTTVNVYDGSALSLSQVHCRVCGWKAPAEWIGKGKRARMKWAPKAKQNPKRASMAKTNPLRSDIEAKYAAAYMRRENDPFIQKLVQWLDAAQVRLSEGKLGSHNANLMLAMIRLAKFEEKWGVSFYEHTGADTDAFDVSMAGHYQLGSRLELHRNIMEALTWGGIRKKHKQTSAAAIQAVKMNTLCWDEISEAAKHTTSAVDWIAAARPVVQRYDEWSTGPSDGAVYFRMVVEHVFKGKTLMDGERLCFRCGGMGYFLQFSHVDGGVCYLCGGSGVKRAKPKGKQA